MNGIASTGRWLGPIMTIGGGAMAIKGFSMSSAAAAAAAAGVQGAGKAGGMWKWGGIGLALGGLALTGLGFKAKGVDTGKKATEVEAVAALNEMSSQAQAAMQQQQTQITTLQQQLAALQQQGIGTGGAGPGAAGQQQGLTPGAMTPGAQQGQGFDPNAPAINPQTGEPIQGTGTPVGVGAASTQVPGAGQQAGTPVTGGTPAAGGSTTTGATTGPGATTGGAWTPQALIGRSVNLAAGTSASGTVIADAGNYRIEATAGDANGYATLDEANNAARATMSTELMGSKFLRWMVVEHGGRYYGAIAKQMSQQDQAQPIDAATGNVVAWSALNHVLDNGQNGWQAYAWSQTGGAQVMAVPYGTSNVFGGGGVGAGSSPTGGGGPGSAPVGGGAVSGGGPVAGGAAFDPSGEVGRTFAINASSTAEGDVAQGGVVQLQKFVPSSTGGFGSAEEAANAARAARKAAGGGDQWKRWVTMQGADSRYYVYEASIVKRETAPLAAAAPMHVFGSNFAEYYDGSASSWKALRDTA